MRKSLVILLVFVSIVCFAQRDSISSALIWNFESMPEIQSYTTHDNIMYTNSEDGIIVYEITDYLTLNKIGEYPFEGTLFKMEYSNDKLYLFHQYFYGYRLPMLSTNMITALDVTEVDSIYELYTHEFETSLIGIEVSFREDTMFCFNYNRDWEENYSFDIYNMASSTEPELIQAHELTTNYMSFVINNNYAYIFKEVGLSDNLLILNLSDYSDITESSFDIVTEINESIPFLEIKDTLLFVFKHIRDTSMVYSTVSGNFVAYNVSNPETLIALSDVDFTFLVGDHHFTEFTDSLMFVTCDFGLTIINFSNPEELNVVYSDSTLYSKAFIYEHYYVDVEYAGYTFCTSNKIRFFDFSIPESLEFQQKVFFDMEASDLEIIDSHLYMNNGLSFSIASISETDTFDLISSLYGYSYDYFQNLSISDSFVVLSHFTGTKIINISDPLHPYEVYSFDSTFSEHVIIEDSLLYQWNGDYGMYIFNISDPTSPVLLSTIEESDCHNCKFYVQNYYLYINHFNNDLEIIDVRNPEELETVYYTASFFGNHAHNAIFGSYFVVNTETGLKLYDISVPHTPTVISEFAFSDIIRDIKCKNHYLYIATDHYIDIYDIWNPESPIFAHRIYNDINSCIAVGDNYLFSSSSTLKKFSLSFVPNYDFTPGWNLVSYPYIDTLDLTSAIPVAEEPAFIYNTESRAYNETTELFSNYSFWVLSSNYGDFEIDDSHIPADSLTLELAPGWNLVGVTFSDVPGSIFESYPEITSPLFFYNRYDRAYEESDTLRNHIGYWILSSDSVEVSIP